MTLQEVKDYLRIDGDEDDGILPLMMQAAEEFVTEAVGAFDETKARAKILYLAAMQDIYENRTLTQTDSKGYSVSPSLTAMMRSLITQLQIEELEAEEGGTDGV